MRWVPAALAASAFLSACDCKGKGGAEASAPSAAGLSAPVPPSFGRQTEPLAASEPVERAPALERAGGYAAPSEVAGPATMESAAFAPGAFFDGSAPTGENPPLSVKGPVLATFQRRATDPTRVAVRQDGEKLVYESGMTIDTDGRINDPATRDRIREEDPNHQGDTSFHYASGRALDPTQVPFIVLPKYFNGARNGDLAMVEYKGRRAYAIVGDRGPRAQIGEGSAFLAGQLGIDPHGGHGGVEDGVRYTVFPGLNAGNPKDQKELLSFISAYIPASI
ncbi:MAG: hypothetical protein HY925_05855 [Elusimicrobia bacterium]|nr:hypothetical protein [Elusimicrobiota bacterium]